MLAEEIKVIDVDCHVTEPASVWTDRVSKKWGDRVPHVRAHPRTGRPHWFINNEPAGGVASTAPAGWKKWLPSHPPTLEDADPAAWDSTHRLERMDEYGLYAQIIYPNVGGFGNGNFLRLEDPALMLECVQAYNDFLTDWCAADPKRLIPITATPFWDVDATVAEVERCAKMGHKGILFSGAPENFGQEPIAHPQWEPLWQTAEEAGLSVNFHIGGGGIDELFDGYPGNGRQANWAKNGVKAFLDNSMHVMESIMSGICQRHPELNIVSVESGVGWLPFVLEGLDWHFLNFNVRAERPELDMLPSEYFKRQIYSCFWFEKKSALAAIDALGDDNFFYETDFPHPTSMAPGPTSIAQVPHDFIEEVFTQMPESTQRKILRDNAARVYGLEV